MAFAPAIPFGGLAGFRFMERTYDRQFAVFNRSPSIQREVEHFLEKAPTMTSLDDLMADRRVLGVVLGAFGLEADIDKRAFIRKVLEDGTLDQRSFANRLVEPAYREMSAFLGFGDLGGRLVLEKTRQTIVQRYREREFENAVGETDLNLRLALNFRREAVKIAATTQNDRAAWFKLLGSGPLRQVVQAGLNLPTQFASIDLDQQIEEVRSRADNVFGTTSPKAFLEPGNLDRMIERFLLTAQVREGTASIGAPGSTALTLLQSSGIGSLAQNNLFASNFL